MVYGDGIWLPVRSELDLYLGKQRHTVYITREVFFEIFGRAWLHAIKPAIVVSGFVLPGIWPLNRAAIPGDMCSAYVMNSCRMYLMGLHM